MKPLNLALFGTGTTGGSGVPETRFTRSDANGDGVLVITEMSAALRALDPYMVRWAQRILVQADRNGDRRLTETEFEAAEKRHQGGTPRNVTGR